jgi:hypothetical protein
MRHKRDWHEIRSTHADVLETLERVVRMHPAGSGSRPAARPGIDRETLAPVVALRPRLVRVPEIEPVDDSDGNDAA